MVGVLTNILEASYQAVVEGLEYGLLLLHSSDEVALSAVEAERVALPTSFQS